MTSAANPDLKAPKAKRAKPAASAPSADEAGTSASIDSEPSHGPQAKAGADAHLLAHHAAIAAEKAVIASQFSPGLGSSLPAKPRK